MSSPWTLGEDLDVAVRGLLGLAVEPQERGDLLHRVLLSPNQSERRWRRRAASLAAGERSEAIEADGMNQRVGMPVDQLPIAAHAPKTSVMRSDQSWSGRPATSPCCRSTATRTTVSPHAWTWSSSQLRLTGREHARCVHGSATSVRVLSTGSTQGIGQRVLGCVVDQRDVALHVPPCAYAAVDSSTRRTSAATSSSVTVPTSLLLCRSLVAGADLLGSFGDRAPVQEPEDREDREYHGRDERPDRRPQRDLTERPERVRVQQEQPPKGLALEKGRALLTRVAVCSSVHGLGMAMQARYSGEDTCEYVSVHPPHRRDARR